MIGAVLILAGLAAGVLLTFGLIPAVAFWLLGGFALAALALIGDAKRERARAARLATDDAAYLRRHQARSLTFGDLDRAVALADELARYAAGHRLPDQEAAFDRRARAQLAGYARPDPDARPFFTLCDQCGRIHGPSCPTVGA